MPAPSAPTASTTMSSARAEKSSRKSISAEFKRCFVHLSTPPQVHFHFWTPTRVAYFHSQREASCRYLPQNKLEYLPKTYAWNMLLKWMFTSQVFAHIAIKRDSAGHKKARYANIPAADGEKDNTGSGRLPGSVNLAGLSMIQTLRNFMPKSKLNVSRRTGQPCRQNVMRKTMDTSTRFVFVGAQIDVIKRTKRGASGSSPKGGEMKWWKRIISWI